MGSGTLDAMSRRGALTIAGLAVLLALAVGARLVVGGPTWGLPENAEFWALRLDRAWAAAIVGASLAVGGVLLQSLLRNPLASPDLIGPAAGAGLAVMIRVYLATALTAGGAASLGQSSAAANAPAALAGSLGALALVYSLSQRRGFIDPVSLVLVGVIVGVICGAATMFVAHLMPDRGFSVARWTLGELSDETPRRTLLLASLAAGVTVTVAVALGPAMDVAALGDDEALSTGVPIARLRIALFLLSGVLTAVAVVLAGPVGFVGLVCPHIVRLLAGPAHRTLVLGSAVAGATLIVAADAAVKAVNLGGGRMPIGVITALVGGPVFIVLLRRGTARSRLF